MVLQDTPSGRTTSTTLEREKGKSPFFPEFERGNPKKSLSYIFVAQLALAAAQRLSAIDGIFCSPSPTSNLGPFLGP